jgi:hypothetical protein
MGARKRAWIRGAFKTGERVTMYPIESEAPTSAHFPVTILRRNSRGLYRVMDARGRLHWARAAQLARQAELPIN